MIEAQNLETRDAGFGWMINHLPTIIWQRRYYAFSVFAAFLIVSVIAAYTLPTMYRSKATLLIEFAGTASRVSLRLQEPVRSNSALPRFGRRYSAAAISSRLSSNMICIPSERRSQPLSTVIDKMRKATSVGALQGDIGSNPNPNQSNVIALNMSFDYPEPQKAQEVLQNFAQSFLRMDSDVTEDQASLTVRFLEDQAQKLQSQIQQIESEITALKSRNGSGLARHGHARHDGHRQLQRADRSSKTRTGSCCCRLADRLHAIRRSRLPRRISQRSSAIYAENHPDVVAAREKLKAVRSASVTPDTSDTSAVQEQIRANNEAIGALRAQKDAAIAQVNARMAGQSQGTRHHGTSISARGPRKRPCAGNTRASPTIL